MDACLRGSPPIRTVHVLSPAYAAVAARSSACTSLGAPYRASSRDASLTVQAVRPISMRETFGCDQPSALATSSPDKSAASRSRRSSAPIQTLSGGRDDDATAVSQWFRLFATPHL